MLILGIETATSLVGCAIGGHEGVLASMDANRGQRHAEMLVPAIEFTCRAAKVELSELGALAVDIGPGLFTGLRVGVATAKTMAQALRVPMIGVSSLDLLAFRVRFTTKTIVVALDARRGEVFHAWYRPSPGGVQRVTEARVGSPQEVASELQAVSEDVLLVGDGALRYADHFAGIGRVELADQGFAHPSAASLVRLAHAKALREDFVSPAEVRPLDLRKPDAEANWVERTGVVGARHAEGRRA